MDAVTNLMGEEVAAGSEKAARGSQADRDRRTAMLKPFRWRKGQSSNSAGRAIKLPMSDILRDVLAMKLPAKFREMIELAINEALPKDLSFMDGLALGSIAAMFSPEELKGFRADLLRGLREATEGRSNPRKATSVEEVAQVLEEAVNTQDQILLGVLKVMKKRQELYNLESPRFDAVMEEGKKEAEKTE